jgi:hypothetical protein
MKPILSSPNPISRGVFFAGGIWAESQGGTHQGERGVVSLRLSPDSRTIVWR